MFTLSKKIPLIRPQFLLYAGWFLIIFLDQPILYKFFLSNLIAFGLCFYSFIYHVKNKFKDSIPIIFMIGLLTLASLIAIHNFGKQENYIQEFIKSIMVIAGGIAISHIFTTETFEYLLKPFPIVLVAYFFIQVMVIGTPPNTDSRISLDYSMGSANTIAYIITFGVLILFYLYPAKSTLKWFSIIFLTLVLVKTFSRSAILGLLGGILFTLIFHKRVKNDRISDYTILLIPILIISSFILLYFFENPLSYFSHPMVTNASKPYWTTQYDINRFFIVSDLKQTHASGRLTAWLSILQMIWQHPKSWLTGYGPGLVSYLNLLNRHYPSIDSLILKFFYSYGVIGLVISSTFCFRLINIKSNNHSRKMLKNILGFFMVFTLITNDTTSASQAIFYGILLIGYVFSSENHFEKTYL